MGCELSNSRSKTKNGGQQKGPGEPGRESPRRSEDQAEVLIMPPTVDADDPVDPSLFPSELTAGV